MTPLTSAEDFIRAKYPGWMAGIGAGHFESEKKIGRLKSPILVIHGTSDEIIPYDLGLKLFNAYAGEKKLITVNGGRHNDLEYTDPGVFWPAIENFIAGKNTN